MDKEKQKIYSRLTKNIGQALALNKLYNLEHPVVKTKIKEVFSNLCESVLGKESLLFAESEGIFLVNGCPLETQDALVNRFIESFRNLKLGSLDLKPGLSLEEFNSFIDLLSQADKFQGEEAVKKYLNEKNIKHIAPLFATYKLVKENETVVEEAALKRIEITDENLTKFLEDLNSGHLAPDYQTLARNPEFIAKAIFAVAKNNDNYQGLKKALWAIGEYLISGVNTAKDQENNHRVLNEAKEQLYSLFGEKQATEIRQNPQIQETFVAINAALEIKGLILLYKKHKKELKTTIDKINRILESLPKDSRLYQQTKQEIEEIGPPEIIRF